MNERKKVLKVGDDTLPPPGDERREVLAERKDNLEEKAETLANEQELHAIDPKVMEVDREIAHFYDPATRSVLNVSNAQPGWVYSWPNCVNQSGIQVTMKKYDGWIVVSGNDPEAREHKREDGLRRIADILLMKIPVERYEKLQRRDELKRQRHQAGVAAELESMGRRYAKRGLHVHTPNMSTKEDSQQRGRGFETERAGQSDPRRRLVVKEATRQIGEMSRERIPGVPLPGEGK